MTELVACLDVFIAENSVSETFYDENVKYLSVCT